ncbi:non-ribosomal peptide synthetase, partial [Chitinophaga sp. 22308]|uniref:non-ribosomal peptide synthetase n=1 Tax=Chitinophaga sp. 22308 TaxID=3453906 RepID=UPI003F865DA8
MTRVLCPLHPSQYDVYKDQLINTESTYYNIGGYTKITGHLDVEKFTAVVCSLPEVFDAFRMRFDPSQEASGVCFDDDFRKADLAMLDFSDEGSGTALKWMEARTNAPFSISQNSLLFEQYLLKISEDEYWYYFKYHHLITDGFGISAANQYISSQYKALMAGRKISFDYPSYREEAIRADSYYHSDAYQKDAAYWKNKITAVPRKLFQPRYQLQTTAGNKSGTVITDPDAGMITALDSLLAETGCSLQQISIAALMVYFARTAGALELLVGTPLHKRRNKQLRSIIGMFASILPYKSEYKPDLTVLEMIREIAVSQREDYRHQQYLIGDLSRHFKINAADDHLLEVVVNYAALNLELDLGDNVQASTYDIPTGYGRYPLELWWRDYGKQQPLQLRIDFNTQYFTAEDIQLLIKRLFFILQQFNDHLDCKVGDINVVPEAEHRLLDGFNGTAVPYEDVTLVDLIAAQALRTPDAPAVLFEEEVLTYRELDKRTNQLAHYLRTKGVGPDVLVPVCLERSPDMIISIVGILKAGGAYVPVDPDYPAERIRFMITDTGANLLLTDSRQEAALREMDISPEILLLDESGDLLDSFPTTAMDAGLQRHHLAYVIYTSGSTGKPKGVMNEHGGIVNRLLWKQSYFGLKEGEGVLQKTTFSFDVSVWELLWPLITGARLVFARPQGQKDADYLKEAIRRYDISTVHFVPSMLQVFLDSVGDAETLPLTRIICSGEALKPQQVHDVQLRIPGAELYNLYGPTEAAIDVTCWHAPRHVENNIIPIGQPVSNTQIHILNERGELLPVGVAGELHIGGVQVARGYLNRPELTAERFITDPFNGSGGRLYRTGDLARWLPDGNIEYLGRIDDQVK